jgi:uncharacterized protein
MSGMALQRTDYLEEISQVIREFPVAGILGPRQCGKTTLAHEVAKQFRRSGEVTFFDLEEVESIARLATPAVTLSPLRGLVIIDEVQRMPALFQVLRVLADRQDHPAKFLILGSASPDLVKGTSESLAGRIGYLDMSGFDLSEVSATKMETLWSRGGFPRSFLAETDEASYRWRQQFVRTFLERDIPQLGITVPSATLARFWSMICHFHGNVWNAAELARSLGTSEPTARRYLDLLTGAFMVRQLPPWFENVGKRQVKSPKVYVRDTGLLHAILQLETADDVRGHPKLGASWEGFAMEQVIRHTRTRQPFFWATHNGAELDMLVNHKGRRYGFEFKHADAPTTTPSMRSAIEALSLRKLFVIYPGKSRYPLSDKIEVFPLRMLNEVNFD